MTDEEKKPYEEMSEKQKLEYKNSSDTESEGDNVEEKPKKNVDVQKNLKLLK